MIGCVQPVDDKLTKIQINMNRFSSTVCIAIFFRLFNSYILILDVVCMPTTMTLILFI